MEITLSKLTDEELALRAVEGQRSCFAEIVRRYSKRLLAFIYPKLKNTQDTEDVIQETFVKAWLNIHTFNSKYRLSTWLYTIAYRQAISHIRTARRRNDNLLTEQKDVPTPYEIFQQKQDAQSLWNIADSLNKDQYDVLWLRYKEDLTPKEIARVMNKTSVHVRVLLHRARINLADRLQQTVGSIPQSKVKQTKLEKKVACN